MKCIECPDYKDCSRKHDLRRKRGKCHLAKSERVPTNADRIRAMTDEELARFLKCPLTLGLIGECLSVRCRECVANWLQQPCGGADHE